MSEGPPPTTSYSVKNGQKPRGTIWSNSVSVPIVCPWCRMGRSGRPAMNMRNRATSRIGEDILHCRPGSRRRALYRDDCDSVVRTEPVKDSLYHIVGGTMWNHSATKGNW